MRTGDPDGADRSAIDRRAGELLARYAGENATRTDRFFVPLMAFQWMAAIVAAMWVAPVAWEGPAGRTHLHVWAALVLGGAIAGLPIALALLRPGRESTRQVIAVGQMLMGALLIHLTGGRIESHFHIFGSLAFLALYRDWRVLVTASMIVVIDHVLRGLFWPKSVYGLLEATPWRFVEHAGWVIFEDVVLIGSCVRGLREQRATAERQAQLEATRAGIERTVAERTAELRRSEARQRAILESAQDGIISINRDGRIIEFNPAAEAIFGHRREAALGKLMEELIIPPTLREAHRSGLRRYLETREARILGRRIEVPALRADGTEFPAELAITPIEVAGEVVFTAFLRDITERRHSEATLLQRTKDLESAQAQLSGAAEFAVALNQPEVQETYRAALTCLARALKAPLAVAYAVQGDGPPRPKCAVGLDSGPLEARPFTGEGLPAAVVADGEARELVGPFGAEGLRLRLGLGDVGINRVVGWPIVFNRRRIGALVTAHLEPTTDEQRAFVAASLDQLAIRMNAFQVEEQRQRLVADLRAQSQALEAARSDAERASRVKSEFLANMSHELRTPMNSIMGFTQRLIRKLGAGLPERELDALRTVDRNAKHLLGLINNILDLSKIEAGRMELNRIRLDLVAVAREAVEQSAALVDGKPIEVVLDLPDRPVSLDGDATRIKQVVTNLLSNAIKYTDRGTVTVELREAADDRIGRVARLAVRDTGVGIKPEDRGRLFQQFTQLDGSPSRKVGGTGLGLVITAQYVRMHGGRIDVTSEYGHGSEFAVILPLASRPEPASVPAPAPAPSPATNGHHSGSDGHHQPDPAPPAEAEADPEAGALTILCVDDEPDILKYLRLTFEDAGYDVLLAADYDGALDGARHRPDLICLDLSMPGKDGFEVLRDLRADPGLEKVPVLVVSASPEQARSLAAGARRFLAKPAAAEDLVANVRELLAQEVGSALVVEDNPDTAKLLAETLVEHGIVVRHAANGREALERLAEGTPSVIVLDLMMPVMDGFAFLARVGQDPSWSTIPVVILTAKTLEPGELARLHEVGAPILTKGRGDTERLVDAILKATLPRRRLVPAGVGA
ncbi:MAG TPA: response regulator [Isosphaeraceae bacterium]|nr:response regulator [Isosphaeraceae bacterium]